MRESIQRRKNRLRIKRKRRVRGKITGSADRPRVSIFKSNRHFYAQAIDDTKGHTLAYSDGAKLGVKVNKEDVKKVAEDLAGKLKALNIETIVFDRNGYLYHGVVASFADALRENGIKF
ncbi:MULTISPECIES: 50S ribosomal protein L18 [unclassified Nitratiruptor]|uniref:Large ribosomal subunit protein uL18 n=1 Tax=Nitratiruptor sp. (strain SB155-2) TaxID=387092 RepID=RL18_NITSB|nr:MULTISPECIES: 50S ribosomal protein L18 [unclassified Nitratiruptor]A6Q1J4.1 RecName: Full=Large ribosomal subunit protein uL18; AltName: Full=50S ribosomal protein L18 [Nitratiruptor sp. SB155-2]BAF69353.1 50S ribosomal protein L18 [Nitratiruptor sp. SB155-2]BCD59508.1 large subunit ribosomal protein L18 [Nitratiruptor sp. YY08-10]BCD63432.1 large subunit ribosomal protein L18 [Nitratiruptor sp. YY08-14]